MVIRIDVLFREFTYTVVANMRKATIRQPEET